MALKLIVDSLDSVPAALREHYVKADDGKFYLSTEGEHPRVTEFRTSNIALLKEREELKTKVADLEAKPRASARISELEAQLAAEKSARASIEEKANKSRVRDAMRPKALSAGVLPAALDILLDKMEAVFTMEGDSVKARPNVFSPTRPGEPLTPEEWMGNAIREHSFLFAPSAGGGATGDGGRISSGSSGNTLRNPTPQQLGEHARAIARGEMKVVYD